MKNINRMKLEEAQVIAEKIKAYLEPHCEEIEIAGSIRRKDPIIKDIDIVLILKPKFYRLIDIFPKLSVKLSAKIDRSQSSEDLRIRVWFAQHENWGFLLAKTTGHVDYTPQELEGLWVSQGYEEKDEFLYKGDKLLWIGDESDLYMLLGISFLEPEEHNY